MNKNKIIRSSLWLIATSCALTLGFLACSNGVQGASAASTSSTNEKKISVTVSLSGTGSASTKGARGLFGDTNVATVAITVYDVNGANIGYGTLIKGSSSWSGPINVSATGAISNVVFEANALKTGGSLIYAGRTTQNLTGSGDVVSIAVTGVLLKGGTIQGRALVDQGLSTTIESWVNTFAGVAGTAGLAPGVGVAASFTNPYGMVTDGTNLYIADYGANNIRKLVIATQTVSTISGSVTGAAGHTVTPTAGGGSVFTGPTGITTDGTYLYVCDTANSSISQILLTTPYTTTIFAGSSSATPGATDGTGVNSASFNVPRGITFDGTNFYVADTGNSTIRMIQPSGQVTTFAGLAGTPGVGEGSGTMARFNLPQGITTDGTNIYVADTANNLIRQVPISGAATTTLAGNGTAGWADSLTGTTATFDGPIGITTDGTYLYVADSVRNTIRRILIGGTTHPVTTIAGDSVSGTARASATSGDGLGSAARFGGPYGIITDGTNLYVSDYAAPYGYTIRKIQ